MSLARLLDHWSPPDGAGGPVGCLATSFTFEADFFTDDCLSRFLGLTMSREEGDAITGVAALLEEEDRLSEAQVSVLVDRSAPADKRNLRWDVLPITVDAGLLHAKVAVLMWERATRILIGSANLTRAGYRKQVEVVLALDLDDGCDVPRDFVDDFIGELRSIVALAPGPVDGAKARALAVLDRLEDRVRTFALPARGRSDLRITLAPARPGVSPFVRLRDAWHGAQPLRAVLLAPFWDDDAPSRSVEHVRSLLTGRPASARSLTAVVPIDPFTGAVRAPLKLRKQDVDAVTFDPPDDEWRGLHAKVALVESDDWLAVMVGSSNCTSAGYGLDSFAGHREVNVWLGCPAGSQTARHLRELVRIGRPVTDSDLIEDQGEDEDSPNRPPLPLGFVRCEVDGRARSLTLVFDPRRLPSSWRVSLPGGRELLSGQELPQGNTTESAVTLPLERDEHLPPFLTVAWEDSAGPLSATWIVNILDKGALPAPSELTGLPIDVVLGALASSRPLTHALEEELRRMTRRQLQPADAHLDPLRRFDDSGLLLRRTRHHSLALWRLKERLDRPAANLDTIVWRLRGPLGPIRIAEGMAEATQEGETVEGEAAFLIAELALTIAGVDWERASGIVPINETLELVRATLEELKEIAGRLPVTGAPELDTYVLDAFAEVLR